MFNVEAKFGECRQATIPKSYEFLFVTFGLLEKGSCYQEGFTEPVSSETAKYFFGDVKIKLYKKSPVLNPATQLQMSSSQHAGDAVIRSAMLTGFVAFGLCAFFLALRVLRRRVVSVCGEPLLQ